MGGLFNLLKTGVKIAAPIAATALGGPLAGAATAGGIGLVSGLAKGENPLKAVASAGLDIGTSMVPGLGTAAKIGLEAGKETTKGLLGGEGIGGSFKKGLMGAVGEGIGQGVGKLGQTMKEGPLPDALDADIPMIKDVVQPSPLDVGKEVKKGMSTELRDTLIGMGINMGTGLLTGQNPMDLLINNAAGLGEKQLTSIFESLAKKQKNKSLYSSLDNNMDDLIFKKGV